VVSKLREAKELLEQTDLSVSEICHQVGYNHQGHFADIFKRFYGAAPLSYRGNVVA